MDRGTDRQTDGWTDGQTGRQTRLISDDAVGVMSSIHKYF